MHESEVPLATSLDDAAFGCFMGAQLAQLELWHAPSGGGRANLFRHTLLGTASCALLKAAYTSVARERELVEPTTSSTRSGMPPVEEGRT